MAKREISNLDLKIKFLKEHLDNGGMENIRDVEFLKDLGEIKVVNGKVDPDTVSSRVSAFMSAMFLSHFSLPPFHPEFGSEYRSLLQKSFSFDQYNINTVEHFEKVYEDFKNKTDSLFRGQREAKWRLYNKLQRCWLTEKLFEKEDSYKKLIEAIVENGKMEFGDQIKKLLKANHIDTENTISILGYLQHHGCPTPLLDWTYKFQNALFFALDGLTPNSGTIEIEDYFSVFYIEEKDFEGSNMRVLMEQAISSIEQPLLKEVIGKIATDEKKRKQMEKHIEGRKLFDRQKISGSGFISHITKIEHLMGFKLAYFSDKDIESGILFSLNSSKNIMNQEGVFMWNYDPSKPIEMVGDELYRDDNSEDDAKNYRFCRCFNIHKKLAEHIRNRLIADGVTEEFIYPTSDVKTLGVFEKAKKK